VANRERPEVLSPDLKNKVERYVAFWREQYHGEWPVNAAVSEGTRPVTWLERTGDRVRHASLRALDLMIPVLYSLVPVVLWQKYRKVKSRYLNVEVDPSRRKS
jgi:hypothetical protein